MTGTMWGMATSLSDLGDKVQAARELRGWSKEQAAREARISSITWKRVEDGLSVHDVKRAAVLRVLELDDRGDPAPPAADEGSLVSQVMRSNLTEQAKEELLEMMASQRRSEPVGGRGAERRTAAQRLGRQGYSPEEIRAELDRRFGDGAEAKPARRQGQSG